ncbi:MAG: ATP-grasp domain-containing protein [Lachnospiraceae bacterium]|nr:ATP-grasp domain-containing protein [Lachnospiraceae bacterium]
MKTIHILFCSVGRRCELLKDFRASLGDAVRMIVTDHSIFAPALHFADAGYQVPLITDEDYIPTILEICRTERIDAITTLIDPEIMILAKNRERFEELGVTVLAPYTETAKLCFDKYEMYRFLSDKGIATTRTWGTIRDFRADYDAGKIAFPVFAKPRRGSGSVGAGRIESLSELEAAFARDPSLIAQELMTGKDMDADVYVDTVSHEAAAIFAKEKISTVIGGANKTISVKDDVLFSFVQEAVRVFRFNGPLDMDLFYRDGRYYLSEVNPRFGGAYLHAFGAGVDFPKLIYRNVIEKKANDPQIGAYDEDVVMMMYDSVVITRKSDIEAGLKHL